MTIEWGDTSAQMAQKGKYLKNFCSLDENHEMKGWFEYLSTFKGDEI